MIGGVRKRIIDINLWRILSPLYPQMTVVRFPNRTYRAEIHSVILLKLTPMGMSEYAFGILHWLGNRTYRACDVNITRLILIFISY